MKYAVDSNILIYLLEANPEFGPLALQLLELLESRGDDICVSMLVFAEASAYPGLTDRQAAAICDNIHNMELLLLPIDESCLRLAGKLRRDYRLKLADATHLAAALETKSDYFITNDLKLAKKNIPGIEIVALTNARNLVNPLSDTRSDP